MKIQSKLPKGVILDLPVNDLEYCNIVYMCIKQKGNYEYCIPENFEKVVEPIITSIYQISDDVWNDVRNMNCYITIKKMYVQPNTSGNRDGWHIDGFLGNQYDFVWSDHLATPTEVAVGDFELTPDHELSITEMYQQSVRAFNIPLDVGKLYYMGEQCVHRPTTNKTSKPVLRTFIKVTFTYDDFNAIGNAWNYKLPHVKPNKQRNECRNHGVL